MFIEYDKEVASYIIEIAKNTALISYYMVASTKAWYEITSFVSSNVFWITVAVSGVVGYLFGKKLSREK